MLEIIFLQAAHMVGMYVYIVICNITSNYICQSIQFSGEEVCSSTNSGYLSKVKVP